MTSLYWPLEVFSKAVEFKNLSEAAGKIGLSQPQLSRLIARIESELDLVLLDRAAKRKSSWTPMAQKLAEAVRQNQRKWERELQQLRADSQPTQIHIGCLEGLASSALDLGRWLFRDCGMELIQVDVFDQNELDAKFLSGDLDLILTSNPPGKRKFSHMLSLGFQRMKIWESSEPVTVLSPFERTRSSLKKKTDGNAVLVSNSLYFRRSWLEKIGGRGQLPSEIETKKYADSIPVTLLASDLMSPLLWKKIELQFG